MIKDSGDRREFGTGGHRDCAEGKGRMDLLPFRALMELSKVFEEGAKKYDDNNWRKGLPLSCYVDSMSRHLAKWMIGWRDEPHLEQAAWNIMCLIETKCMIEEGLLPADLNDLPYNVLEILDNPNKIPPLRTSSKRAPKEVAPGPVELGYVPKAVIDALDNIRDGKYRPIQEVIDEVQQQVKFPATGGHITKGHPAFPVQEVLDKYYLPTCTCSCAPVPVGEPDIRPVPIIVDHKCVEEPF